MLNTARPAVHVRATAVEGPSAEHFAVLLFSAGGSLEKVQLWLLLQQ
jgi:hypothetical protein